MQAEEYLKQFFQNYYKKNEIPAPPAISQREFGVGFYGKKIANRHFAFPNTAELNKHLKEEVPFYISYSAAYYSYPNRRPMQAKEFLGADLIYEFDADDIKTPCKQNHDSWKCKSCGESGNGLIENCTKCGSAVECSEWVCNECLEAVKKQVFRLLDFLEHDFAITDSIGVNFSGHKGYHIHIRTPAIKNLSHQARIELIDYLTANSFYPRARGYFLDRYNKRMNCPVYATAVGWDKRILDRTIELFKRGDAKLISKAGNLSLKESKDLINKGDKVISEVKKGGLFQLPGRKTEKFWLTLLDYVVSEIKLDIDRQTSADIAKIIRVPETIHGGSGLLAKTVALDDLKNFKPLEQAAIPSEKTLKVKVKQAPKFTLLGQNFGPYEDETAELPEPAAVYLLARGASDEPFC